MKGALKLVLLIPVLLLPKPVSAGCPFEYSFWSPYPTHQVIFTTCSDPQSAYDACGTFAMIHNYTQADACGPFNGTQTEFHAGNLYFLWPTQAIPFALDHFYTTPKLVPDKNLGCPCPPAPIPHVGDPVNPGIGNKTETKTEFSAATGAFPLAFSWTYDSLGN